MRRTLVAAVLAAGLTVAVPGSALAQEPTPPEVNCYPLLSSLICEIPVNIGPFTFDIDIPVESVFPPAPTP